MPRSRLMVVVVFGVPALWAAVSTVPVAASGVSASPSSPATKAGPPAIDPAIGIDNIDHLIFIVQENRSFDHYFGTFPGADGIPRRADGSFKVCAKDPVLHRCVPPYHSHRLVNDG